MWPHVILSPRNDNVHRAKALTFLPHFAAIRLLLFFMTCYACVLQFYTEIFWIPFFWLSAHSVIFHRVYNLMMRRRLLGGLDIRINSVTKATI